jgi:hypothetical protein
MSIDRERFREKIETPWEATFDPPYDARAEWRDYGMRAGLAVFRDGEKLFDAPDLLVSDLLAPGALEGFARHVKRQLAITNTE